MRNVMKHDNNDKEYRSPEISADSISVDAGFCTSLNSSTIDNYKYYTDDDWGK